MCGMDGESKIKEYSFIILTKHLLLPPLPICLTNLKKSFVPFKIWFVSVWPDLAKFHHFGKLLKDFGNIWRAYLVLATLWTHFGKIMYGIGQSFIVVNGPNWKHKLAIWSHWFVCVCRTWMGGGESLWWHGGCKGGLQWWMWRTVRRRRPVDHQYE